MDDDILKRSGVYPVNPRIAYVKDYVLRIGKKATLLRSRGEKAYGIVYSISHDDIDTLYNKAGLDDYAPEALIANINNENIPVLCCNLIIPPEQNESNQEYAQKLKESMHRLGVPCDLD